MSNTTSDPYEVAAGLGLVVEYEDPGDGLSGLFLGDRVLLRPGMTSRDERSVLGHELGHHYFGQVHIHRSIAPKVEAACDLYAAEMLIDEDELLRLAKIYPDEPGQIAYELNVADWVLDAYVRAHPLDAVQVAGESASGVEPGSAEEFLAEAEAASLVSPCAYAAGATSTSSGDDEADAYDSLQVRQVTVPKRGKKSPLTPKQSRAVWENLPRITS